MADDVRLTELELIKRYSIAVRGETADRSELVAVLRADLAWLQGGSAGRRAGSDDDTARPSRRAPAAKPARRATARTAAKATKPAKPARRAR